MRKGTFSVQNANVNSSKHNSRETPPKYLIDNSAKNYYELIINDDDFREKAAAKYKDTFKQNMQKAYTKKDGTKVLAQKDLLIKETVITLKKEQNENDVKALFEELNKKFGGHHLTEVSIHRDEGHFLKDDIAYYPTKNILNKNGEWYICSNTNIQKPKKDDFDKLVNINDFEKVYNYHAHAKFSNFDMTTAKTAKMNKSQMSERIKFVSKFLGLDYAPSKDRHITKSVNQIKDEHLARANVKREELAKVRDLNALAKELRAELKENKATRANYAELEQLNKDLKAEIKNKNLTLDELKLKIDDYKQNKALQSQESIFSDKVIANEVKTLLGQNKYDIADDLKVNKKLTFTGVHYEIKLKEEFKNEPKVEEIGLFKRITKKFNKLKEIIQEQANKIFNLEEKNKTLENDLIKINKHLDDWKAYARNQAKERNFFKDENIELKEKLNLNTPTKQQKPTKQQQQQKPIEASTVMHNQAMLNIIARSEEPKQKSIEESKKKQSEYMKMLKAKREKTKSQDDGFDITGDTNTRKLSKFKRRN